EYMISWKAGLSATVSAMYKTYDPLINLPPESIFVTGQQSGLISTSEVSIRLRYAHLERFLETTFNQYSLGSASPILEAKITKGISGIFQSRYDYTKFTASISDYKEIAPYGSIYYNFFGGRTYGKLPYMLLDIAPGNEIYYYNKYAFSLMNRYEFLHD